MEASRFARAGLSVVAFPPSWLGIAGRPRDAETFVPIVARDVMADPSVRAALDGPMFGNCDEGSNYESSRCSDPRFALLDSGVSIAAPADTEERRSGVTVSVLSDGTLEWTSGEGVSPRASVAVQTYPSLVQRGRVSVVSGSGDNGLAKGRAALAELEDGRLAFVVGTMSLPDFAAALGPSGLGVRWAGYTDGGGSTSLAWREAAGGPVTFIRSSSRPVAVFLIARPPTSSVLSPSSATVRSIAGVLAAVFAAIALLGFGMWVWLERDWLAAEWDLARRKLSTGPAKRKILASKDIPK